MFYLSMSDGPTHNAVAQDPCLDAFIVALNQPSEGGEKDWYTSTKGLQLASLGYCVACRGAGL